MKLEALDHPKTLDFAARLQVELPAAIGHLELLWAFTGKKAPQGNVGKWPDGAIARACYWMGRPEVFTLALQQSGFIDADQVHRFTIHDWHDHAPGWVRAKLKKLGIEFIPGAKNTSDCSSEPTSERSSEPPEVDFSSDSSGLESLLSKGSTSTSTREVKGGGDPAPDGLDLTAWSRWLDYRKQIRKPLKQVSIPAAQRELAAFGSDQAAVVERSVANGWQGIFPLKDKPPIRPNGNAEKPRTVRMFGQ